MICIRKIWLILPAALTLCLGSGCAVVRRSAAKNLSNVLAASSTVYASDDDPELVREALPFSLKLMELALSETPQNEGLLLALASGFTQYAYAFIKQDADKLQDGDFEAAEKLYRRAAKLCLRARNYAMRAMTVRHPGLLEALVRREFAGLRSMKQKDVRMLYWTAVSWSAALNLAKDNPDLIADQPTIEALIDRAYELSPDYDRGAIHSFLVTYEMSRQGIGDMERIARVRHHYNAALRLKGGQDATTFMAYAEGLCLQKQDHKLFKELLEKTLEMDPDTDPDTRLVTIIMQEHAQWLLSIMDELFLLPAKSE